MRLADLPNYWPVACDTETSGLQTDSRSRIAVVSFAFRQPCSDGSWDPRQPMVWKALTFDQGVEGAGLHLGAKVLDDKTAKRVSKWPEWARQAPDNLPPSAFQYLTDNLQRFSLIWGNGKFDMNHFRVGLRARPDLGVDLEDALHWDTVVCSRLLWPLFPAGVKETGLRLNLGRELGFDEGSETREKEALKPWLGPQANMRFDLVPWSVMEPYAMLDAALTLLAYECQFDELWGDRHFDRRHFRRELDLLKVLYRMEHRGIAFDVKTARRMAELIETRRQGVARELPFDPTPVKARNYFFGADGLGHPVFSDKVTPKRGDPQVDDEVIARLASEAWPGQEVAQRYQLHEGLKSANAKWYDAWPDRAGPDGRLRTNFKQADVISGRLAVGHIQLQAIPQPHQMPEIEGLVGVRDLFHEDTMCPYCRQELLELWEFDISQAEIRIATAMAQCHAMLAGFLRGDDSHSNAARLMFADLFAAEGFTGREEEHPDWSELRGVAAKRSNLGILYGAGSVTIRDTIKKFTGREYPLKQIREWIDRWHTAFPEMGDRLDLLQRKAARTGWVRLINGRQRWFQVYEPVHKAFNQEIQGSLAEVMKDVMILVENAVPDALLLQIHDSLVLRLPPCRRETYFNVVQHTIVDTFEQAFTRRWSNGDRVTVPFTSDAKRFGRYTDH